MSTVKVQCPCGAEFERPIQRGRPAIWCEACRVLPVAQRAERAVETDAEGDPIDHEKREHDDLTGYERDAIEIAILEVSADYRERIWPNRAKIFADLHYLKGPDPDRAAHDWLHFANYRAYNRVNAAKWPKGNLIGFKWDEWDAYG
jgi:hypothetical protein